MSISDGTHVTTHVTSCCGSLLHTLRLFSLNESCHTCECVMAHMQLMSIRRVACVQMSHGTHMSVMYHTYEQVMTHTWVSWRTNSLPSGTSRVWKSHATAQRIWTRCIPVYTRKWVMAHIWMSHGTHMNQSRERWRNMKARACVNGNCVFLFTK